jgi:ribosomal protein S27E
LARTPLLATHFHTYKRHRPEQTLLYQLVERHYPEFQEMLSQQGKSLPYHVEKEFGEFLKCGRLEHGFLRVVCDDCKHEKQVAFSCKKRGFCPSCGARRMAESAKLLVDDVLKDHPVRQWVLSLPIPLRLLLARYPKHLSKVMQIIHRAIATDIIHRAGYLKKQAKTGAVTYIQRFGSALNLNIHFHMLFLEGVITQTQGQTSFKRVRAPSHSDMERIVNTISHRIAQYLEKVGLIQSDQENTYLDLPIDEDDSLLQLQAASVSYRIAVGADAGKKVFSLQTLPAKDLENYGQLAKIAGFSLHAGVFADTHQPEKLERLCRYIARPAVSEKRLSLTTTGNIRYELKTPYTDGTTHVFFAPIDFISKLAALIPPPRLNLTRFYGVFAPNANVRAEVTASQRGKNSPRLAEDLKDSDKPYHARSMSWAQRLKRVFNIDITICEACESNNVKIIACITQPAIINKILMHLDKTALLLLLILVEPRRFSNLLKPQWLMTTPSNEILTLGHKC